MTDGQTDRQTKGQIDRLNRRTDRRTKVRSSNLGHVGRPNAEWTEHWAGVQPSDVHLTYITMKQAAYRLSLSYLSPPYTLKTASQQCARVELDPVQEADGERATSVLCRCESVCVRGAALGVSSAAFRLRATPLRHQAGSKGFSTLQIKSFTANLCDIFFAIQISSSLLKYTL